ncbi:MAG: hypothetical protein IJP66_05490 [Kiritimatiellae bacterium]|nr:hypothetical protein [Kiritimatiellia bacterium]
MAATTVIASADTYTWHGPDDAVGSGTFGTAGNWFDSTGNRTQSIPGSSDDIVVGNNGVNTWTAQLPVSLPGMNGNAFAVKALVKFTGPMFFEGSTEPNEIRVARLAYVEP